MAQPAAIHYYTTGETVPRKNKSNAAKFHDRDAQRAKVRRKRNLKAAARANGRSK